MKILPSNIFWPLCLKVTKLGTVDVTMEYGRWPELIFRSHGQRSRSICAWKNVVCSISFDPFAGKFLILVQWLHLSTAGLWKILSDQYLLTPLFENHQTWYIWCPLRVDMFPIDVQVTWSNVKVKLLVVYSISNESSYQGQTINCNLTHRNAASKKNVALFCHQTN